ncbi:hypothetical protein [Nocardioides pacificus]
MTALTRPRGPLPARVYWTRRLVLLAVSVLLVAGIARLLDSGSDASSDPEQAAPVAADATDESTLSAEATATESTTPRRRGKTPKPAPAQPDGPCLDEDVVVTPVSRPVEGGADSVMMLNLTTREAAACTWRVSPETLTVKITSGDDEIWFSRHCPDAVPTRDLIVRKESVAKVGVTWSGRRSDDECSPLTAWAMPGGYHVEAAALSGEPAKAYFELEPRASAVVTRTVTPKPTPSKAGKPGRAASGTGAGDAAGADDPTQGTRPGAKPSGAVEPD